MRRPAERAAERRRPERDIEGLAVAIGCRSGRKPERPWVGDSTYSPAASIEGRAAERAIAAASFEPATPGHLRQQIVGQIELLEAAVADLEGKAAGKATSATAAAELATSKEDDAANEAQLQDHDAPERARRLRVEAVAALAKARRHLEMGDACQQAATAAGEAVASYRTLLIRLDDPNHELEQIGELARMAAGTTGSYHECLCQALPIDHLDSGVPTDRQVALPVDEINAMLAEQGSIQQIADGGPVPMPGAQ